MVVILVEYDVVLGLLVLCFRGVGFGVGKFVSVTELVVLVDCAISVELFASTSGLSAKSCCTVDILE